MKNNILSSVIPLVTIITALLFIAGTLFYVYQNSVIIDYQAPFFNTSTSTRINIATSTIISTTTSTTTKIILPKVSTSSVSYSKKAISECAECSTNGNPSNLTCCTASFENDCAAKKGVTRWTDGHPGPYTAFRACYEKAPDTGKSCAVSDDCLSGVCNLESAIATSSAKCSLINKVLSGEKNRFYGQDFFTATYSCTTAKPGVCMEAVNNGMNPGGVSHTFKMDGKTLIETLESGPIF